MNRVLEKAFPSFSRHPAARSYYASPEGSTRASVVFRVQYGGASAIADGRVVLFFAPAATPEPRFEAFELEDLRPMFAQDVQDVEPGGVVEFESSEFSLPDALGFVPADLSKFEGELFVQALVNTNLSDPDANTCVDNWFSAPTRVQLTAAPGERNLVTVVADQPVVNDMDERDTEWVEHISLKSELLSAFHKQDVHITAAVVLPKGYHATSTRDSCSTSNADTNTTGVPSRITPAKTQQVYPTVYYIEGFTGTEAYASRARAFLASEMGDDWRAGDWPAPMLRVTLGSRAKFGHTSFADSETNGPWGSALVHEFLPFFERRYPSAVRSARGRFLHGHSSGGWATLWLQLQFPDAFGGTWSTAPDPVDFAHFQLANIYSAANMYWDPSGRPVPTYRCDGRIICSVRDENQLERVYARGNGGQWDAFFAVFGPRDERTGMPKPLFDKLTGDIDADVARQWERFDICKWLRARPELLASDALRGKIHVLCGVEDNYYLNDACKSLQVVLASATAAERASTNTNAEANANANANATTIAVPSYVELVPGDHTTIRSRAHYQRIYDEIARVFASRSSSEQQ